MTADSLPSNTSSFLLPCTFYIKIIKTCSKIIKNLSSAQMSWIESWTTRCQIRQLKQQWAKVEVTVTPLITCWDCTRKSLNLVKALTLPVLLPPWNGALVEGQVDGHKCESLEISHCWKSPKQKAPADLWNGDGKVLGMEKSGYWVRLGKFPGKETSK